MYDAGVALSGFSCFVSPDLARDLANDVMSLVCVLHKCNGYRPCGMVDKMCGLFKGYLIFLFIIYLLGYYLCIVINYS
jgi:hypothetical protein